MDAMTLGAQFDDVLLAAQAGGEWAVTILYRDLNPSLVRFLTARAGAAGEDIAQDVWLGVGRSIGRFEGNEKAFRAWLFTIARRRLIEHWRQSARRPSAPVDSDNLDMQVMQFGGDPAEVVEAQLAAAELVAGLSPDQAEIVLLRVVAGLEAAEVAKVMGKSAAAVRVMQHRALKRLANRFHEERVTR